VQEVQQPEPPQNQEVLKALSDLAEIKEELKQLRNAVEEIQFETENAKRRQQDLFQDLDRRMASVERNESLLNPQTEEPVDGQIAVVDGDSGEQQSGGQTSGSANQVVVSSSDNTASSATSSATGQIASATSTGSVTLQEQEAYDQGFELLKQSRYEDAINQFQLMADTWPDSQLADDSYYWMSEARYVNREFEHALSGFRTVVSRYPDSQRVPEALLKVGYIQYDIGAYEEAAETFRDILARFPGHQVTVAAQTRLRRIENTIQ
jgi:tol-pal system protein YbgF